jgi:methylmalonyl-CoA mutase N-terminal domain/subunit
VEYLTSTMERDARGLLDEVAQRGGAARAVETGFFQGAISRAAYSHQRDLEKGDRIVVGVNRFDTDEQPRAVPAPEYSALADQQRGRVANTRAARDQMRCRTALDALGRGARGAEPLMPLIVDAVRARATVGEMSDVLRDAWGVYRPA